MQEKNDRRRLIPRIKPNGDYPARHRSPLPTGGRPRIRLTRRGWLAVALVALTGLVLTGAAAVAPDRVGPSSDTATLAAERQSRAEAAGRADRAERPTPTATATAEATPTPATPAPSTTTGEPTRRSSQPAATGNPPATQAAPQPSRSTTRPAASWVDPMPGAEVTSCFGQRWGALHAGIDLAQPADTPVRAAGAGTVVNAGWAFSGYGISVVIDHGNGYLTHYAHLNRAAVAVGQKVPAGRVIGYEGSTGDSTGPHLHFEVHDGLWKQIDPAPWMRARGVDLGC